MLKIITERNKGNETIKSMLSDPNSRKMLAQNRPTGTGALIGVLMEIGFPIETLNQSKLSKIPMSHIVQADEIFQLINNHEYTDANKMLDQIEHEMSKFKLSRQEFLLLKARLYISINKSANETLDIIKEAIEITFPGYTDEALGTASFLLHEPDLIYNKAVALSQLKKYNESISILSSLVRSLKLNAMTDRHKNKTLSPVYLTLCNLLYSTGRYEELFLYSNEGSVLTVEVSSGRYIPYFKFLEAKATLKVTGRPKSCISLLMEAYSSFLLSGEKDKAKNVLESAKNDFDLTLELYGADQLHNLINQEFKILSRGFAVACKNPSELIEALCSKKGIPQKLIYEGIMTQQAYSKAMKGKSNFGFFNLEAMGQRLGVDISIYDNFMLGNTDYRVVELRNEIQKKVALFDFSGMTTLTDELLGWNEKLKSNVIVQIIEYALVMRSYHNKEIDSNEYRKRLRKVLEITLCDFDENNFKHRCLTQTEICIINQCGSSYDVDEYMYGAKILDQLMYIHRRDYMDEVEGSRTLGMLYMNYSSLVGLAGNANEAFKLAKKGLSIELSRRGLTYSHGFFYNMAFTLLNKNKSEALAYFVLSYYGAKSMATYHNWCKGCAATVAETVKTNYGILLE